MRTRRNISPFYVDSIAEPWRNLDTVIWPRDVKAALTLGSKVGDSEAHLFLRVWQYVTSGLSLTTMWGDNGGNNTLLRCAFHIPKCAIPLMLP